MKTIVTNKFHKFEKIINHKGALPSVASLKKAVRNSKPSDCQSETFAYRDNGDSITEIFVCNRGRGIEVFEGQTFPKGLSNENNKK